MSRFDGQVAFLVVHFALWVDDEHLGLVRDGLNSSHHFFVSLIGDINSIDLDDPITQFKSSCFGC